MSADLGDGLRARVEQLEQQHPINPEHLEQLATAAANRHRTCMPADFRCTCGFGVWSVEHVVIMSIREALRGAL